MRKIIVLTVVAKVQEISKSLFLPRIRIWRVQSLWPLMKAQLAKKGHYFFLPKMQLKTFIMLMIMQSHLLLIKKERIAWSHCIKGQIWYS